MFYQNNSSFSSYVLLSQNKQEPSQNEMTLKTDMACRGNTIHYTSYACKIRHKGASHLPLQVCQFMKRHRLTLGKTISLL